MVYVVFVDNMIYGIYKERSRAKRLADSMFGRIESWEVQR